MQIDSDMLLCGNTLKMGVYEIAEVPCHWHDVIEVIWVLCGKITIQEANMEYYLREGDIYVVNYNETHKMTSDDPAHPSIVILLHFDYKHYSKYVSNLETISFSHYCFNNLTGIEACLKRCRAHLKELSDLTAQKASASSAQMIEEEMQALLPLLVDTFQYIFYTKDGDRYVDGLTVHGLSKEELARLHELTYFIYLHCMGKISLEDIARSENYSKYYTSHFIKKALGISYQDTVSMHRAILSERVLLGTNYNLDEVADTVGFSTRSQFCTQFKKWHGISPSEYRKQNGWLKRHPTAAGMKDISGNPIAESMIKNDRY